MATTKLKFVLLTKPSISRPKEYEVPEGWEVDEYLTTDRDNIIVVLVKKREPRTTSRVPGL